jgi:CubicO group peptidase (beta-lactamase class C family)
MSDSSFLIGHSLLLTRRCFIRSALAASAWLGLGSDTHATSRPDTGQVDSLVRAYLAAYDVPGLSLAYGSGERIVFAQAYGLADRHGHQQVTLQSLFRIASLSKPFTSAAIFTLVEAGKLHINNNVFGPAGILKSFALRTHADWLQAITVEHLLTHTGGGWSNKENDPMFHETDSSRTVFIQQTLDAYPLEAPPGTRYAYSNFGYFLLGRIIEEVSGMPYGQYTRQFVQEPLSITDMRLGTKKSLSGNRVISNDADRFKRFYSYFFCPRTHLPHGTRIASPWLPCFTCVTPTRSGRFRFIDSVWPTKHLFGHDRP